MGIQPIRKLVAPEIPDKLYFRIGDVARICEVPAYVLRFWETEFPQLKPTKGGTGQRLYRRRDVEMALRIKSLLYDLRYTIPGARQVFKDEAKASEAAATGAIFPAPTSGSAQPEPGELSAAQPTGVPGEPRMSSVAAQTKVAPPKVASSKVASAAPAAPATPETGTDLRRHTQISALRDEVQALLSLLQTSRPGQLAPVPEPKPMRPRLVLEPRPAAPRTEVQRPETLRLVRDLSRETQRALERDSTREPDPEAPPQRNQGDLFSGK